MYSLEVIQRLNAEAVERGRVVREREREVLLARLAELDVLDSIRDDVLDDV